ncbi:hypothetical protein Taro_053840 [Colocasia esculenta]|uniref:Ubiquitin-like protease family profile domain-containing protein n=1 Tax=Colocasia esculenta TaxID=4460 RepID=A0A843XNR7_COLES|nr:hypothetical protein [Colocasia esculenta]
MLGTLGEERLVDVTILDCFWYHMYLNGSPKVMEWIKEKGIFSKTYIFVPIVDGGHWNLLILCNLGNSFNNNYSLCMILLDSLIISELLKAEPTIRRFVKELYHTQGKLASSRSIASIPLLLSKVPQQRDGEECGVFMLYYIYLFLKSAPATFSFTSYPYFMIGKKVKLLDLENEQVAEGIVMSMDPAKIVMGRPIGTVYCEVSIHYANKPDAPLCWWMRQNEHYLVEYEEERQVNE